MQTPRYQTGQMACEVREKGKPTGSKHILFYRIINDGLGLL